MIEIVCAESSRDIADVKAIFLEYAESLGFETCFEDFDTEMAGLPGKYGPPQGILLLARDGGGRAAGAVGLCPLDDGVCEMRRLYVRPAFRGTGLGGELARALITEARRLGYRSLRLETLPAMAAARRLYRAIGFGEIERYNDSSVDGIVFMELEFDGAP